MSRARTILLFALGAAAAAVPAGVWLLASRDTSASGTAFTNNGTGLEARDVQAAISELAARVKSVESGQASLQGAAAGQEQRIAAVQSSASTQESRIAGQDSRLDTLAARLAEAAPIRRRLDYVDAASTQAVAETYQPLRTIGTFSKLQPTSTLLLTWSTHVDAIGDPGSFCDFQLRVDGAPDTEREGGGGRAIVYISPGASAAASAASVAALFTRVGPGSHTVSIWVRGSARECQENFGNFPRSVLVEEGPRG